MKTSSKAILWALGALIVWLLVTYLFIGLRPEHMVIAVVLCAMFFICGATRRLMVALLPFIIFAVSYDWMNLLPNYQVNSVDIQGLYTTEKALFGISTAQGVLTPNEFFAAHTSKIMDFMGGIFYLCWVPVPVLFGLWLYFKKQRAEYLHFSIVFLLVNLIGFAGYYIHPAAPPWYVANYGFDFIEGTPGNVAGLGAFDRMTGLTVFDGLYGRNANVFAAVPSLHSAYTLIAFIYALRYRRTVGWAWIIALGIITAGIWFTAVYTSHHYVIDVLLGISCALVGFLLFEYGIVRIPAFGRFMHKYANYISAKSDK
ncbi:MAG: phosphatase PAP2 family protein [Muribaculaceae bacterium]|nr:phosphatase PAP2 family protein [Muribaculaceae bacterium]